jgi:hypothetical protein
VLGCRHTDGFEVEKGAAVLAYTITLFVRTSEPVAQRAAGDLVGQVVQREPGVSVVPQGDGVGWASYELSTARDLRGQVSDFERDLLPPDLRVWPVAFTVHTGPATVKERVARGLRNGGPAALGRCDGFVELVLVGHLQDWELVEVICAVARERWEAVVGDDHDGFRA